MKAYYSNTITNFLVDDTERIIGILTHQSGIAGFHQQLHKQTTSWNEEIILLKRVFLELSKSRQELLESTILLEYPIARREKRIDIVLLINDIVTIIEFKAGKAKYERSDIEQLTDYCLDLRDFHFESRKRKIVPILLAPSAAEAITNVTFNEQIASISYANEDTLSNVVNRIIEHSNTANRIDPEVWNNSIYAPTPTIIEAAQTLFSGKTVEEISRSHAGTKNLTKTKDAVIRAIHKARTNNEKIICFITGVPGAGKTLAGLDIAHYSEFQDGENSLATFLSGNGPLIKVLREALGRDAHKRLKKFMPEVKKREQKRIISFVENVHNFLSTYFNDKSSVPNNKVVIFDEAQRAWNAAHSKRKFNRDYSEPEMMFEVMNRHDDWAAIIALIGGGQEINTGEAGLREWGNNILNKYKDWKVYVSPELKVGNHSTANLTLFERTPQDVDIHEELDLHLNVAIRSYKAEDLSKWVQLVLDNEPEKAKRLFVDRLGEYEIAITRNLDTARAWLKMKCKGTRRMGLVASSGGRRLRAYGLDVKAELEEENWFLNDKNDVRSSYSLELPATEFGIQGLELDWTGMCWDADLRRNDSEWDFRNFRGATWDKVKQEEKKQYTLNKYRVLLTRAREGMVIWIPEGDKTDASRLPEFYDPIYTYLKSCGVPDIS